MNYLPLYLNITGKKILIIGGGKVAAFKLEKLLPFTDNITVWAVEVSETILSKNVEVIKAEYTPESLADYALIYACTNKRELNHRIKKDAESLNIPVNVVDNPSLCDFISPAVYAGEHFTIAVSTSGTAPAGAARIRDMITQALPADTLEQIVEEEKGKRENNQEGE
ncbi:bifunctional precorrin-2 dehydrogenase/sirohydrochlorin ferrochelatase [Fibrobacterota bacterium]